MKLWLKASFAQAAWAPILVFLIYGLAAKVFGAYRSFPHLDILTRLMGVAAIIHFCIVAINRRQSLVGKIPRQVGAVLRIGVSHSLT